MKRARQSKVRSYIGPCHYLDTVPSHPLLIPLMSYSTLFSSGLFQLWDTQRPAPAPITISLATATNSNSNSSSAKKYRSFLSFDVADSLRHVKCINEESEEQDEEYRLAVQASSFSRYVQGLIILCGGRLTLNLSIRRSFESVATVPPPTRTRTRTRSRSTASSSFFVFDFLSGTGSGSGSTGRHSSEHTLTHRRSLPEAKPAPRTIPPQVPRRPRNPPGRAEQCQLESSSSWLPPISVSMFSPSLPYFSFDSEEDDDDETQYFSSSSTSSGDGTFKRRRRRGSGASASSTSTVTLGSVSLSPLAPLSSLPAAPSQPTSLPMKNRTSTASTATATYRRAKRSHALAQLEGRGRDRHPHPLTTTTNVRGGGHSSVPAPTLSTFVSFTSDDEEYASSPILPPSPRKRHLLLTPSSLSPPSKSKSKSSSPAKKSGLSSRSRRDNFIDLK